MLRGLEVFADLSDDLATRLARSSESISVGPGTDIVREGRIPTHLFVILAGIADVWSTGESGTPEQVTSLQEGDYFGEIGLIEGMPSTATVRSKNEMRLLRLPAAAFLEVVRDSPATIERLLRHATGRLATTHPTYRSAAQDATESDLVGSLRQIMAGIGPSDRPPGHQELLRSITSTAMNLFGAAACSLALVDGDELVFQAASGEGADEVLGLRIPADSGIAGAVVSGGSPLHIPDVARDPRFAAAFADSTGFRPTTVVAGPLRTKREILGVIEVLDPTRFDAHEGMTLLALFAGLAAQAIESGRTFSTLLRRIRDLLGA
jgi:CRP-like cAMP-binding protein/putative methionine-R-sulfoxide reductase with GAF domain